MWGRERMQPRTTDPCRATTALEVSTEAAETAQGREDIFTFGQAVDPAFPFCQAGKHQATVSDRLVAGDGQFTRHPRRR